MVMSKENEGASDTNKVERDIYIQMAEKKAGK
jgi:hypothetical protein